ncbi:hypothetical protein ACFP7A_10195 [Sporolactobacillus kofuensis]|uniref:Uncharacterized protein n=1 Tax=Sporolactobacillus kofuensis TaxID=269672 RepID=A0ABW1WI14_9BACL|nr:hypothetical protein [Sporolactobacillus kofuensis]MCO7176245.1 hypothetical protein [Sporolactobacillus kofuensis]
MVESFLQLFVCYGIIGLIMGSMLGIFPFWHAWKTKHFAAFVLLIIAWLPISMLTLLCAPIANWFHVTQDGDF